MRQWPSPCKNVTRQWLTVVTCILCQIGTVATSDVVSRSKDLSVISDGRAANVQQPQDRGMEHLLLQRRIERRREEPRPEIKDMAAIIDEAPIPKFQDEEETLVEQAPPIPELRHSGRRWWQHLKHLTHSLGLLQTSGTVTRHSVLDPAILVVGLVSMVIALSAVMAFCTHGSSTEIRKPVRRYPAPPAHVPPEVGEGQALGGRSLATALRARGSKASTRPSEVKLPTSAVSVPCASETSLPMPKPPSHIGGEAGGMFSWSPRSTDDDIETLCPCLVVPDGMEFVFAVREVLTVVRQELSFSVVDLDGSPLSHIIVNETGSGPQCGIFMQMLDGEPLASIRTDMLHSWPGKLPEMCDASGEVFCRVAKGDGRNYVLRDNNDRIIIRMEGNFKEKMVKVTSWCGELVAISERCIIGLDSGPHYQVRVAPGADAGLVLCSLLAVDKIEGGGRAGNSPQA